VLFALEVLLLLLLLLLIIGAYVAGVLILTSERVRFTRAGLSIAIVVFTGASALCGIAWPDHVARYRSLLISLTPTPPPAGS